VSLVLSFHMPAPSEGILGKGFHGTAAVKLCVSTVHAQLEKFVNQGTFIKRGTQWKAMGPTDKTWQNVWDVKLTFCVKLRLAGIAKKTKAWRTPSTA
jgi:hypothetical protein